MIRYYTYYSCGGYKDLYIGSDTDKADASYFVPLLNIWKKNNKPGNEEKIRKAESVQQVGLITISENFGFPAECILMFSHGGFNAIYRTLSDGRTCLCIRDVLNNEKDEEGRDIPFNILFLADEEESIEKLDGLAFNYLSHESDIKSLITNSISYDAVINGIKFDLAKFNSFFTNQPNDGIKFEHRRTSIDYLLIGTRKQLGIALSEQKINKRQVNAAIDSEGLFYGELIFVNKRNSAMTGECQEREDITRYPDTAVDSDTISTNSSSQAAFAEMTDVMEQSVPISNVDASRGQDLNRGQEFERDNSVANMVDTRLTELMGVIESNCQSILAAISTLGNQEAIRELKSVLGKLSDDEQRRSEDILVAIGKGNQVDRPTSLNEENNSWKDKILRNNNLLLAVISLIAGLLLGALIFSTTK